MSQPVRNALLVGGVVAVAAIVVVAALLRLQIGPFADESGLIALNRLRLDFARCPTDLAIAAGTDVYRECREPVSGLDVRVTAGDTAERRTAAEREMAFDSLPNGAIRLHVDGVAPGTVDVLSCRSYAQDPDTIGFTTSVAPSIAYGSDPMTAAIVAEPYLVSDWPDNRWQTTIADPTEEELTGDPSLYGTSFDCTWFLLPPGSLAARPGLIRTYTATDAYGEPAIHVLGPGGPGDPSSPIQDPAPVTPVDTFDVRSLSDGTVATTGDNAAEHYVLPAGSWVVSDRTTGRQAVVDVAPGQTTRIVSVTAIADIPPGSSTPVALPPV